MNVNSSVRYGPPQHREVLARADEAALTRAELRADAELFKVDEEFARSLGIEMPPSDTRRGDPGLVVDRIISASFTKMWDNW